MKKVIFLGFLSLWCGLSPLSAQVGINTETPKATLDVVAGSTDGSTSEGIIYPRLTLQQLNAKQTQYTADQRGTQVYIYDYSGATVAGYSDEVGCIGLYLFNGTKWRGNCGIQPDWITVSNNVKSFTFYEDLQTGAVAPLTFSASGSGIIEYQWFRIIGSNVHVRLAQRITSGTGTGNGTGYNTATFTPIVKVGDGNTKNANNNGFYRFFCRAYNVVGGIRVDSIESQIAEIAVGCGAKNKDGEWLSFMCFNLGATEMTIAGQKNHTLAASPNAPDGLHSYRTGEEAIYGDLYQWGRIRDGHQVYASSFTNGSNVLNATNNVMAYVAATPPVYESGELIGTSQNYPHVQVKRGDPYYGKFITTGSAQDYNWANPAIGKTGNNLPSVSQAVIDMLWRGGRFAPNDPCAKVNADGTTYETFYPPQNGISGSNTGWKTPSQEEWGYLYRGGTVSGSPGNAFANTWTWYGSNGCGFDIKPDGVTTTLHLPATGIRRNSSGTLYRQGDSGYYWSTTNTGNNAHNLSFYSNNISPADANTRSYGFAVRCIRSN
ncbi:MAG: fibrobacter succinogenes major paralogous domain-containing protein [Bacteroidales bacterium]|jgi:uncharacterized protein (TIGR02145 family)|nr:fibrobacter succinogenes major paralogous domain-containing protein [Bacteroidales bacterium]